MQKKRVGLEYSGKNISLDVLDCNCLEMGRGLMFRFLERSPVLLFDLRKKTNIALTSLFVFFDFLVVWLDENDKVIDVKKVKPFVFTINQKKSFRKIIEIPFNKKNEKILKFFGF